MAWCLKTLAVPSLPGEGEREQAARLLLEQLRDWGPAYVRKRFSGRLRHWPGEEIQQVVDDAIQHLFDRLVHGKFDAGEAFDDARALGWCKRVISNFIISEFRFLGRTSSMPPPRREAPDVQVAVESREELTRLVHLLRSEIQRVSPSRRIRQRLQLFNDFMTSLFGNAGVVSATGGSDRFAQRRSRGRRVARAAWKSVRERALVPDELLDLGRALGLAENN